MDKRIIITGATGFIGGALGKQLVEDGYEVVGLTRRAEKIERQEKTGIKLVLWDGSTGRGWSDFADGAYAIINLAGENVGAGRWSKLKKQRILDSRLNATGAVVEAVKAARQRPQVVVQASAIGYYGDGGDQILDEEAPAGVGFLAEVCRQGERTAQTIADMGVRLVVTRIGVVLGCEGGMLARVAPMYRKFLGGCPGAGRNWLSWVHIQDIIGAVMFLLEKTDAHGPINVTAPHPVRAGDFYRLVGKTMRRPAWLGVPAFALKLLLGDMAGELLLTGQRALPKKLLDLGYGFQYYDLTLALKSVLNFSLEN